MTAHGQRWGLLLTPVVAELHPDDVLEVQLLAGPAVTAEPAAVGHADAQAVRMEGGRARLAAQEAPACQGGGLSGGSKLSPAQNPAVSPLEPYSTERVAAWYG